MGRKRASRGSGAVDGPEYSSLEGVLSSPWTFLCPTSELHDTILKSAKHFLDPLASSVSDSQTVRQRINRKRKRSALDDPSTENVLQLKQLYADGFTPDQIWEQASRILTSAGQEIEYDHALHVRDVEGPLNGAFDESDEEMLSEGLSESDTDGSGNGDEQDDNLDYDTHDESNFNGPAQDDMELDLEDGMDDALDDDLENEDSAEEDEEARDTYTEDRFGLNDGFFSIDDFNKQTELLEHQDARGEPDDADSEEEDIDWHVDPLVPGNAASTLTSTSKPKDDGSDDEDDSDEEGPTFDSVGLDAASDSEEDDGADGAAVGMAGWLDTSDIKYADFFAPPPRKATTKRSRPLPKTQPDHAISEEDVNRAMANVRRDLFEDEMSDGDNDEPNDDTDVPQGQRSTHEQQRARIADEIRRLEAANVAKKEWMLSGEARAIERPVNSLIEEDLEFERIGKPVPVVTTEVSEGIEELVKRRILAKEFDEVIRRRPGVADGQASRRETFELEDTKAQQSLAEIYENEHLRQTDPNYVDPKNQKLMREHAEIANLWKDISSQLDTLSNWHYKPNAPQASINVITDVATIMMEDAQPTTSNSVGGAATLAPQEVYTPGDDGNAPGEVILKTGAAVSKEEMSRDEKARLRRQGKKAKKANAANSKPSSGRAAEKQQIVSDLKKGGVKVIGKEGEVTDIHGQKVGTKGRDGGDVLKL
ncbi:U3 small nucleolar ribonucleoprotein complex, subunit Mpp10 [Aspergillus ambiguus]|uniref:rRNA-processing protein MPP10 n=1 Tax=Aspergillus ambiguus TaxID=176160 RepID=UPI003CCCA00E